MVALKQIVRKYSTGPRLNQEFDVLKALTDLAKTADDSGRLLRLREVIYQDGERGQYFTRV